MTAPVRVFHLADDLGPRGAAKQLATLIECPPAGVVQAVGVLGAGDPFGTFDFVKLPLRTGLDLAGMRRAWRAVRDLRPAVIHAWGPAARRTLAAGGFRGVLATGCEFADAGILNTLAGRRSRVVEPPPVVHPSAAAVSRESLGIPAGGRLIACVGGFARGETAARDAVWAFDTVKHTARDLRLLMIGDGPGRAAAEAFARTLGRGVDRVHFAGLRADVPAVLAAADLAWLTVARGGRHATLEAMAAGVPVVAVANVALADYPAAVVAANDPVALAAETLRLLDSPAARAEYAARGREFAAGFPPAALAAAAARVYHDADATT